MFKSNLAEMIFESDTIEKTVGSNLAEMFGSNPPEKLFGSNLATKYYVLGQIWGDFRR